MCRIKLIHMRICPNPFLSPAPKKRVWFTGLPKILNFKNVPLGVVMSCAPVNIHTANVYIDRSLSLHCVV